MATDNKSTKSKARKATAAPDGDIDGMIGGLLNDLSKAVPTAAVGTLEGKHAIGGARVEDVYSTGSIALDKALGVGGLPSGRIVEIYGPEASGKTTLCLHTIASAQAKNHVCGFIDAEHALDPDYAANLGVQLDRLILHQPDHGEQGLQVVETLADRGARVIVVDSVAALVPKAELEGDMGASLPGAQARLMSQAMRKLSGLASRKGVMILFINQIRYKIGVTFGSPETTSGGNALKFYASIRLDIRRIGAIKVGDEVSGNRTRVKVIKNKLAPPFKKAEFDIIYGQGIDIYGELIDFGLANDVIQRSGSYYKIGDRTLGQGRERAREAIMEDLELFESLKKAALAS